MAQILIASGLSVSEGQEGSGEIMEKQAIVPTASCAMR